MTKRSARFDDFDRLEAISCGAVLPGGDALLFAAERYDEAAGRRVSRVLVRDLKDGRERALTAGGQGEGSPNLSPDGTKVLFLSTVPGRGRQVYVCGLDGGNLVQVTHMRFGASDPAWSPDGAHIAFASLCADDMDEEWLQTMPDPEREAEYERERAKQPIIIEDFGYKFDGLGFAKPENLHLFVVPADGGGPARRITSGRASFLHHVWAPDSKSVLCESNLYCDKANAIAMDLLSFPIDGGEAVRLTRDLPLVSYPNPVRPVFTPDGKYVIVGVLQHQMDETAGYPASMLHRVAADGSEVTPICVQTDDCFDCVMFPYNASAGRGLEKVRVSEDGQRALFAAGCGGECRIYAVPIYGEEHVPTVVARGKCAYMGMGQPKDGLVLVARTEWDAPEGYYWMEEGTGRIVRKLYQSNEKLLGEVAYTRAEDFFFDTLDGNGRVHGFCLPPHNAQPGKKYPCIVYVHGGPHPFYTYAFDHEYQCFAGEGFGVLFCNPRGSSGYGDEHRHISHAFNGDAYTDILQFVSEAERRFGWIDGERLGFTGGSYGGYMTNYTAARSGKFKAYISQRSVVSDLISHASSDMQGSSQGYGSFEEMMVDEIKSSVIVGMEKVNAPFLILHGEDDLRCPVEGAHQLFVALKDTHPEDFPIEMVLYPHVGHDQPRRPDQRRHYYRTMLDWFRKYL
jgi:dipeptidyl aminopeptidase/acylaminoacyl peptidase